MLDLTIHRMDEYISSWYTSISNSKKPNQPKETYNSIVEGMSLAC